MLPSGLSQNVEMRGDSVSRPPRALASDELARRAWNYGRSCFVSVLEPAEMMRVLSGGWTVVAGKSNAFMTCMPNERSES